VRNSDRPERDEGKLREIERERERKKERERDRGQRDEARSWSRERRVDRERQRARLYRITPVNGESCSGGAQYHHGGRDGPWWVGVDDAKWSVGRGWVGERKERGNG